MPGANTFGLKQKMIRRKKNVKKGIQFCLMVCGASGTGTLSPVLDTAARPPADRLPCSRPDHLRQHPLRQDRAGSQGIR